MPEPTTATEALISLAEIFAFKASTEQHGEHGEHAVSVWRQAAEIARGHLAALASVAATAERPGTPTGEGPPPESRRIDPGAAPGATSEHVTAAVDAAAEALTRWFHGLPYPQRAAEKALVAAAPHIRAIERERIATAIEREVCEPGTQCPDRFCPDCIRYQQAMADAAIARREQP